jgi:iron complex transport system ATP-binding protein
MIDVADLSVTLSDKPILENYSLSVGQGDVLAILGANGVGKTTLLNCIVGLARPSSGSATSRGRIGYVPQLFHSTFAFSVLDIVLMGRAGTCRPVRFTRRLTTRSRRNTSIDRLDTARSPVQRAQRRPAPLVMIARCRPKRALILTSCSALVTEQSIVIDTLRALNDSMGLTIVFSTHAPQHGLEVASHVLLMKDRRRYDHGCVDDVLTAGNLSSLYDVAIAKAAFADGGKFTFAPYFER